MVRKDLAHKDWDDRSLSLTMPSSYRHLTGEATDTQPSLVSVLQPADLVLKGPLRVVCATKPSRKDSVQGPSPQRGVCGSRVWLETQVGLDSGPG